MYWVLAATLKLLRDILTEVRGTAVAVTVNPVNSSSTIELKS